MPSWSRETPRKRGKIGPMTDSLPPGLSRLPDPSAFAPGEIASPELLAAVLADGDDDMAAWLVSQALVERSRAGVYDDLVRPAMALVGARWESGQWSISVEHLASVALGGALARLRPNDAPESRIGPTAVLAAPENEMHVAGLACLAQVLQDGGWHTENLGANVPADDLVRFVAGRTVDLVAMSVGTAERVPLLQVAIDSLRAAPGTARPLPIMVGGHGLEGIEASVTGADLVTTSLSEAERFMRSLAVTPD
jgi:MerR family transcriptional regulator, light-induced transcriptional regulator